MILSIFNKKRIFIIVLLIICVIFIIFRILFNLFGISLIGPMPVPAGWIN